MVHAFCIAFRNSLSPRPSVEQACRTSPRFQYTTIPSGPWRVLYDDDLAVRLHVVEDNLLHARLRNFRQIYDMCIQDLARF